MRAMFGDETLLDIGIILKKILVQLKTMSVMFKNSSANQYEGVLLSLSCHCPM